MHFDQTKNIFNSVRYLRRTLYLSAEHKKLKFNLSTTKELNHNYSVQKYYGIITAFGHWTEINKASLNQ